MPKINTFIFCLSFLVLENIPCFSQVSSVSVNITEISNDSMGPWINSVQNIDSLDQDGIVLAKTGRVWDGISWLNQNTETFIHNTNNQVTDNIKFNWNGSEFIPQIKTERSYNPSGDLILETNYRYDGSLWTAGTKNEYDYNQQSKLSTVTSFTFVSGSWTKTEQHTLNYNSNLSLTSEFWSSWNGSSWDTLRLKSYNYSTTSQDLTNDSTFYYSSFGLFLQQSVQYFYSAPTKTNKLITREFNSFLYSDVDTSYIESELYFEYTLNLIRNSAGQVLEKHGEQTKGSAQAWAFEHKYFQFNSAGELSFQFSHEGTNIGESYLRLNNYNYPLMNIAYITSGTSCIGCLNGSIDITASGGVAPYHVTLSGNAGTIIDLSVRDLPPGNYNLCVVDNIGNEICRYVTILESTNGINKNVFQDLFGVQNILSTSEIRITNNYNHFVSFSVFDVRGKVIVNQEVAPGTTYLSLKAFQNGNYFYRALSNDFAESGKLIIVK